MCKASALTFQTAVVLAEVHDRTHDKIAILSAIMHAPPPPQQSRVIRMHLPV